MNDNAANATIEPLAAPRVSPKQKLVLLWGFLLSTFMIFHLVYWPVRERRERLHPAAFEARAHYHIDRGENAEAIQALQAGIEAFHPPYEAPYALLLGLFAEKDEEVRRIWALQQDFYKIMSSGFSREPNFAQEFPFSCYAKDFPPFSWTPHITTAVDTAAASFATAVGFSSLLPTLSNDEKLAMLLLAWGDFSFDGSIGATDTHAPLTLLAYSGGGMDHRRGAHLFVGGVDYASRRRGMHVALLDSRTGALRQSGVFDLWESEDEARRLQRVLDDARPGIIGMFAVRDEGSVFLGPALEAALLEFGLARRAYDGYDPALLSIRSSFAAIGVKGAPQGAALQTWSPEILHGHRGHPVVCAVFVPETAP